MMNVLRNIGYKDLRPGDVYINRHVARTGLNRQEMSVAYALISIEHEVEVRGSNIRLTWLAAEYGTDVVTTYARENEIIPCETHRMFLRVCP